MSNINGGMGRGGRSALSSVDFYRRVPKDLTEVRVIDFLSCWFCDTSNSKQEPAKKGTWSISVGHVRRILVQNGIPAGNLMDLGWDTIAQARGTQLGPRAYACTLGVSEYHKRNVLMICPPFTHDIMFSHPFNIISIFVLLSHLCSLETDRNDIAYRYRTLIHRLRLFVCCAR